uniref:Uncharacterized protein n=1 Tax=Arundo donax TaxID=35708 RepID=A0A0A9HH54_ARUDO
MKSRGRGCSPKPQTMRAQKNPLSCPAERRLTEPWPPPEPVE